MPLIVSIDPPVADPLQAKLDAANAIINQQTTTITVLQTEIVRLRAEIAAAQKDLSG